MVGASATLTLVAGVGRMDFVEAFFDGNCSFHGPQEGIPGCDFVSRGAVQIDTALPMASLRGRCKFRATSSTEGRT